MRYGLLYLRLLYSQVRQGYQHVCRYDVRRHGFYNSFLLGAIHKMNNILRLSAEFDYKQKKQ